MSFALARACGMFSGVPISSSILTTAYDAQLARLMTCMQSCLKKEEVLSTAKIVV